MRRQIIGAILLSVVSGVFSYVVLDQIGAALVCAGCVFASLIIAKNL